MIFLHALASVALVGNFDQAELSKWMGKGYAVKSYPSLAKAEADAPKLVIVNQLPASANWLSTRDSLVTTLKSHFLEFRHHCPGSRIFLVLPTTTEKAGFSPRTLEEEVVPLLRQAAEEAEVATIPLESSPSIGEQLAEAVVDFSATKARWHLVSADSEETDEGPAGNAIDGKLSTYWHTRYSPKPDRYPHQLVVDMAEATQIAGFRYVPRQDGGTNGRVKRFSFYTSLDGSGWGEAAVTGTLPNTSQATIVRFSAPIRARFFKFVALSEQNNQPYASAAEIDVVPAP